VARAARHPLEAAMCVVTEFRCIEANEPNALAEGVDGIPVNDINVARFYRVSPYCRDLPDRV
jgi:hypothetical protein